MLNHSRRPQLRESGGAAFGPAWKQLMPSLARKMNVEAWDEDKRINKKVYEQTFRQVEAEDKPDGEPSLKLQDFVYDLAQVITEVYNDVQAHISTMTNIRGRARANQQNLSDLSQSWNNLVTRANPFLIGPRNIGLSDSDTNQVHQMITDRLLEPLIQLRNVVMNYKQAGGTVLNEAVLTSQDPTVNIIQQIQSKYYQLVPYGPQRAPPPAAAIAAPAAAAPPAPPPAGGPGAGPAGLAGFPVVPPAPFVAGPFGNPPPQPPFQFGAPHNFGFPPPPPADDGGAPPGPPPPPAPPAGRRRRRGQQEDIGDEEIVAPAERPIGGPPRRGRRRIRPEQDEGEVMVPEMPPPPPREIAVGPDRPMGEEEELNRRRVSNLEELVDTLDADYKRALKEKGDGFERAWENIKGDLERAGQQIDGLQTDNAGLNEERERLLAKIDEMEAKAERELAERQQLKGESQEIAAQRDEWERRFRITRDKLYETFGETAAAIQREEGVTEKAATVLAKRGMKQRVRELFSAWRESAEEGRRPSAAVASEARDLGIPLLPPIPNKNVFIHLLDAVDDRIDSAPSSMSSVRSLPSAWRSQRSSESSAPSSMESFASAEAGEEANANMLTPPRNSERFKEILQSKELKSWKVGDLKNWLAEARKNGLDGTKGSGADEWFKKMGKASKGQLLRAFARISAMNSLDVAQIPVTTGAQAYSPARLFPQMGAVASPPPAAPTAAERRAAYVASLKQVQTEARARGGPDTPRTPAATQSSSITTPAAAARSSPGAAASPARRYTDAQLLAMNPMEAARELTPAEKTRRKELMKKPTPTRKKGFGRWTDYGGPNFAASTAKVYKQISRGGARAPRRPKSVPSYMDYADEGNDPNETGMGYSGGRSEMITTEGKHAYMDKNWTGLPKVWSVGKGVKLRNAHYKVKEKY